MQFGDSKVYNGGELTAVQYNTAENSTVQYSTVQDNTVEYCKVQDSTVEYSTVQDSTEEYNSTVQDSADEGISSDNSCSDEVTEYVGEEDDGGGTNKVERLLSVEDLSERSEGFFESVPEDNAEEYATNEANFKKDGIDYHLLTNRKTTESDTNTEVFLVSRNVTTNGEHTEDSVVETDDIENMRNGLLKSVPV